jgi:hypothetical protein
MQTPYFLQVELQWFHLVLGQHRYAVLVAFAPADYQLFTCKIKIFHSQAQGLH